MRHLGWILAGSLIFGLTGTTMAQHDIDWTLDKAIRIVEYREKIELPLILEQVTAQVSAGEEYSDHPALNEKITSANDSLKLLIPELEAGNIPFDHIGRLLYRLKLHFGVASLIKLRQLSDEKWQGNDDKIINALESISTSVYALDLERAKIDKVQYAISYFKGVKIGMLKNKTLRKGRELVNDVIYALL